MINRHINLLGGLLAGLVAAAFTVGLAGYTSTVMAEWGGLVALIAGSVVFVTMVLDIHNLDFHNLDSDKLAKNHKTAEVIAGLVFFLGAIFTLGLIPALISLLFFAQLALNIRADNNNRIYSALVIGFICLMCGAVEAKTGDYLMYMACFGALALLALRSVFLRRFLAVEIPAGLEVLSANKMNAPIKNNFLGEFSHHSKLIVVFLGLAFITYLFIPRFPAGNLGARVSASAHFYNNSDWEQKAKNAEAAEPDAEGSRDEGNAGGNDPFAADKPPSEQSPNLFSNNPQKTANNSANNSANNNTAAYYDYGGFDASFAVDNPDPSQTRASNALILRVKSDVPLYLKARVFDNFDGLRWSQTKAPLDFRRLERGNYALDKSSLANNPRFKQQEKYYQVFVEASMSDNIPIAEQLIKLSFPAVMVAEDGFGQWSAGSILQKGTAYSAEVQFNIFKGRQFSAITAHAVQVTAATTAAEKMLAEHAAHERLVRKQTLENYLSVPAQTEPRVYQLASEKTQKITGEFPEFKKAIALEHFLRSEYAYDFASIFNSQGVTPIERFLFETKKGHCEYFASALAIMLRTLDIPARVVTGFLAHNQNPLTNYYEVRALDGHAWVEAYVDDIGWLVLEPTAYYPAPEVDEEPTHMTAKKIQEYIKNLERIDEVTAQPDWSLATVLRSFWYAITLIFTVALAAIKVAIFQLWWLWIILAFVTAAGFWVWAHYAGQIKNRYLLLRVQKMPAIAIVDSLNFIHQALINVGRALPAGLTIEQFNACVASSHLNAEQQAEVIALFNDHYYSDKTLAPQQQATLAQLLRQLLLSVLNVV